MMITTRRVCPTFLDATVRPLYRLNASEESAISSVRADPLVLLRDEADIWKRAATPSQSPVVRPIPLSQRTATEVYYKEYSQTADHVAVNFHPPGGGLSPSQRLASLRMLLPALAHFLEALGLVYWLDFGTLLGSWRNESLIPWDTDGDVGVLAGPPLHTIARRAPAFRFHCTTCVLVLRFNYSAVDIPFMFVDRSTGVYIDVFQYGSVGSDLSNAMFPTYSLNVHPRDRVLPTVGCRLEGRLYQCPRGTEEYLRKVYMDLDVPWAYRDPAPLLLDPEESPAPFGTTFSMTVTPQAAAGTDEAAAAG